MIQTPHRPDNKTLMRAPTATPICGIYLPTAEERGVFWIDLGLKGRAPEEFDLGEVAGTTDGYTAPDAKKVVTLGLKFAFHADRELANDRLLQAMPEIRPLLQTEAERLAARTERLERHTRAASWHDSSSCVSRFFDSESRVCGRFCCLKRA